MLLPLLQNNVLTAAGPDTTPSQFAFTDQTGVALSTVITSNTITPIGYDTAANISIVGGTYSINGGAFTAVSGTINPGDTVAVRHTSAATKRTDTDTVLTIDTVSDTFTSTTLYDSGAGSNKRRRYYVEVDGQAFPVNSAEEAQHILQRARALAEREAEKEAALAEKRVKRAIKKRNGEVPQIRVPTPKISVSPELQADTTQIRADIERLYKQAAENAELRLLLQKKMADDDEEDDLMLLL